MNLSHYNALSGRQRCTDSNKQLLPLLLKSEIKMCFSSNSELIRSQKEDLSHHGNVYTSGASKKILISFSLSPGLSL